MKKIIFAAQKGGVGKTTMAAHVSVELANKGYKVVLIDADPQASLADWWNARENPEPQFASVRLDALDEALKQASKLGYDFAIIDMPGLRGDPDHILGFGDMAVVPTGPSPLDIRAVGPTIKVLSGLNVPFVFLLNSVVPRTTVSAQALTVLASVGRVAPVQMGRRGDYASSMIDGRVAQEVNPKSKSAQEVSTLTAYILEQFITDKPKQVRKQAFEQ